MNILEVREYRVYYKTLSGYVRAVDGVDLDLGDKVIMGIIGESGCGKSTLAQSLISPKYPMIYMGGKAILSGRYNLVDLSPGERRKLLLRELALIPQYALDALPVIKKIKTLISDLATDKKIPREEAVDTFKERLRQVNLPERVLDMYPLELSGGMRQRVVIALSTIFKPKLLIADEPTSALDVVTQRQVLELLRELRDRDLIRSLVLISHDIASIRQIADEIATMYAGKIIEIGSLDEIIKDPLHPYTSLLIKSIPPIGISYRNKRLSGLGGTPPSLLNPPPGCRFHPRCPLAKSICSREEPPLIKVGKSIVRCWLYTER